MRVADGTLHGLPPRADPRHIAVAFVSALAK